MSDQENLKNATKEQTEQQEKTKLANNDDDINFAELEENEFNSDNEPEIEEQEINEKTVSDVEEIKPGQLGGYTYIKNPKVGESVTLTLKKVETKPGSERKNPSDGSGFTTGLKNKKGEYKEFNLITKDDECFSISSWGLFYNIFGKDSPIEAKARELKTYEGITIKIIHNYNGRDSKASEEDIMKLRDLKTLDEAKKYKEEVAKATKEGRIYTVELVE